LLKIAASNFDFRVKAPKLARNLLSLSTVRVLIADDDRELASALASYVGHCNEEVVATVTSGGIDVVRNVDRFQPDVVIMDIMMPRLSGLFVCHHILSRFPSTKIILLSGRLTADHPDVTGSGAVAFLPKPVRLKELGRVLEGLIDPESRNRPENGDPARGFINAYPPKVELKVAPK